MTEATRNEVRGDFRDPVIWGLTLAVAALHLAYAGRYDFFRNELYFIICGRHPDYGYFDQPALVPLLAAATQLFGESVVLLRLPVMLAAAALVPVAAAICRRLGGGRAASVMAALAVAAPSGMVGLMTSYGTSSFEPIGWTLSAYLVLRAVQSGESKPLLWAGITAGLCFETKFGVALWVVGLCAGLPVAGAARLFGTRGFWLGALAAVALGAPALLWQALHGWPFFSIIRYHSAEGVVFAGSPLQFILLQARHLNYMLAPLWLAGLIAPFAMRGLKPGRIVAIAFLVTAAGVIAAHGKDYYLYPAYPALFAVGAVAAERLYLWLRVGWFALALANAALIAPFVLPILSPPALAHYLDRVGRPAPNERAAIGAPITQLFSDEFGWRELAAQVAAIYRGLPEAERVQTAIYASNYGEAAAIDVFAPDLPPSLSNENQYFLWGPPAGAVATLILVNADRGFWQDHCATLEEAGRFGVPYAMPYERDRPILICRGLQPDLAVLWPALARDR